jgi:tetratricopeptide (TPR) repeat protein
MQSILLNRWIVGIVEGALATILAGILLYRYFKSRNEQVKKSIWLDIMKQSHTLFQKGMPKDALGLCQILSKQITCEREPLIYRRIYNMMGVCYAELGLINKRDENFSMAIQCFKEALKTMTVDADYDRTNANLANTYNYLFEIRNKETNLIKSKQSYKQALKVNIEDKFIEEYSTMNFNLVSIYGGFLKIRDRSLNIVKSIAGLW